MTISVMPNSLAPLFSVLIASDLTAGSTAGNEIHNIQAILETLGRPVTVVRALDDAEAVVTSNPALSCVVLNWALASENEFSLAQTSRILKRIRSHGLHLPVLLGASRSAIGNVPIEIVEQIEGYIWLPEDSPEFIAGRIDAAAKRYLDTVLPPFFGAMANFASTHEYSWHTPGHTGGTAFMKTAVGRAFLGFYGEQMLRSDLSISVENLGSLNDHSDRGREGLPSSPPSELCMRFSRTQLSSRSFPHRDWLANTKAFCKVKSPRSAKKALGQRL